MSTLLCSASSPYSAKVRMAAALHNIDVETDFVITSNEPEVLISANPLGKIPAMICDDGVTLFDSRVIMLELDRLSGKKLFPRNTIKRREAERLEAAADGLCDALLAQVYERRIRPEDKVHVPWLEHQAAKVNRALDWLDTHLGRLGKTPHGGHVAVYSALGYADLRFPDLNWQRGRPKLKRFVGRMDTGFPQLAALKPS